MSIVRFGVRHPVPVNLLTAALLGGGLILGLQLRREFFPEITPDQAVISMPYPGASPQELEETLAIKVEDAVADLKEVQEIRTIVVEGQAVTTVEVREGFDPDRAVDAIENAVYGLQDLPAEAENVRVSLIEPRMPVIRLQLYGPVDELDLKRGIRAVRDDLRTLAGMGELVVDGARAFELAVEVAPAALMRHGLSLAEVSDTIGRWLRDLPGGTVKTSAANVKVRTLGVPERAEEIRRIPLRVDRGGASLRVEDVATVAESFVDDQLIIRHNGQPSMGLTVFGVGRQDIVTIAEMVRAYVQGRRGEPLDLRPVEWFADSVRERAWRLGASSPHPLPVGSKLEPVSDLARFVESRLDLLLRDAGQGTILVFLTLWLVLNLRIAFWVAAGLITAVAGTIIVMYFMDVTLNLLTMFGLIVVIGLMVDDAIVVSENTQALYDRGLPAFDAAERGTQMMLWSVVATVAIVIMAFLPLLWVKGTFGDLIGALPVVVAVALTMSLLESLLILPSHLAHALVARQRAEARGMSGWFRAAGLSRDRFMYDRVLPGYRRLLAFCLKHRLAMIAGAFSLIAIALAIVASGRLVFTFLPKTDSETLLVEVRMPIGTPAAGTAELVRVLEEAAAAQPETRTVTVVVGESADLDSGQAAARAPHVAQIFIELAPTETRRREAALVTDSIRAVIAGRIDAAERVSFGQISGGPGGADIAIRIRGQDLESMGQAAADLKGLLGQIGGLFDVADDLDVGQAEVQLVVRPQALALGLDQAEVARQVRGFLFGFEAHVFAAEQEDITVRVRLDEPTRRSLHGLENVWLTSPDARLVPLCEVADIVDSQTYATIRRIDRQRAVTVTASTRSGLSPETVVKELIAAGPDGLSPLERVRQRYPGLGIEFTGRQEQIADAFSSLPLGFLAGLLMIYCTLAWLFASYAKPLLVMLAVPFSIVGVVGGHLLMGFDLTFLSLMGFVALSGVVVNDSLILMEFFNHQRAAGKGYSESLLDAGQTRLRAIGLTMFTGVVGLAPLMVERSFQARFLIPMAISLSFGLVSSAILVLFVLPCVMLVAHDCRAALRRLWYGGELAALPRPGPHAPVTAAAAPDLPGP